MLRSAKDLEGYAIGATDGDIGTVNDFYFDDTFWTVRYLVVDTGDWLPGRRVLLPSVALGSPDPAVQKIFVNLTRFQVKNSPDIDTHKPVSRQHEAELYMYYGWAGYWIGDPLAATGAAPFGPAIPVASEVTPPPTEYGDPHLQSTNKVIGYGIHASDGDLGHAADFLIDDHTWAIRYVVIEAGHWFAGKKVLVAPEWVDKVSWEDQKMHVHIPREMIRNSPEFDPSTPVSREYERSLYQHYGRPTYWT